MTDQPSSPARLFGLLAREEPVGVIIRRGPTRWAQLIKWDTKKDTFEPGQWFNGRIYERRCDISPNGNLLIYFAQKLNAHTIRDKEYTYAWTAISKPPYFTALALWPKGDCWNGGGLFKDDKTVLLNSHDSHHPNHQPKGLTILANQFAPGEDAPIYHPKLEREGWKAIHMSETDRRRPDVWTKVDQSGRFELTMRIGIDFQAYGGYYVLTFTVRDLKREIDFPIEGHITWADWDQRNRLVFARDGKLFVCTPQKGNFVESELADFNNQHPEPMETPNWAKKW